MILRVELYGRLRDAGLGNAVELEFAEGARARDVLALISARLPDPAVLAGSVAATDERILGPDDAVAVTRLAVLPPVCGG